jgi:hypothetical protein
MGVTCRRAAALGRAALFAIVAMPAVGEAAPQVFTFPAGGLLKWAVVSDQAPCAGRPVVVAVFAQDPAAPLAPVEVYVDGDPGTPQILQLFAPVSRKVPLFARARSGSTDRQEITLDVTACPAQTTTLRMLHHKNPFHSNRVDFRAVTQGRGRARSYRWFFGDGQQKVTTEPFVSHDYSASVDPRDKFNYYTVTVLASPSGLVSGKRIALGSSFDLSRKMGFVQADVRTGVIKTGQGFVVDLEVKNHHPVPFSFNRYLKQYLPCDTRQKPRVEDVNAEAVLGTGVTVVRPPGTLAPGVVTVPSGGAETSRLVLSLEKIPAETCAVGFNLIGTSRDRKPVYGSFYLPVRRNPRATTPVVDEDTLLAIKTLKLQGQLPPGTVEVTGEDLYMLEQRGLLERTKTGWRRVQ